MPTIRSTGLVLICALALSGCLTQVTSGDANTSSSSSSGDGRYVAFVSAASNLVPGDSNSRTDVFLWDRQSKATSLVVSGNGNSSFAGISDNGRYVAYVSEATQLVPWDINGVADLFTWDRTTGTTTRVTNGNWPTIDDPDLSADGRYIAFCSQASNLVAGQSGSTPDVFIWDRATNTTSQISDGSTVARRPVISDDGSTVAYAQIQPSGATRIVVWSRSTGATVPITSDFYGYYGVGFSPVISHDGRFVAYSARPQPVGTPPNLPMDIYTWDRSTGVTTRVTAGNADSGWGYQSSAQDGISISGDGRYIAFDSYADNLIATDTNGSEDVFIWDRTTGASRRLSENSGGPTLSSDGKFVNLFRTGTSAVDLFTIETGV